MIIIDGVDGTGKTTFCKEIAEQLSMQYLKIKRDKNSKDKDGFNFYLDKAKNIPLMSIVDRFHLSEYVYPQLQNEDIRKPLKIWQQHMIERILLIRGTILIYIDASDEFIENIYLQRNDKIQNSIKREKELFSESLNNTLLPFKIYLTNNNKYDNKIFNIIKNWHDYIIKIHDNIRNFNNMGVIQNPIMIVGDNIKDSEYLQHALYIAGFKYPYYITNSENKDKQMFLKENYYIHPRQIIALGDEAQKLCQDSGISTDWKNQRISFYSMVSPQEHEKYNGNIYDYAYDFSRILW